MGFDTNLIRYIEEHPQMRDFFVMVTASPDMQVQLYETA